VKKLLFLLLLTPLLVTSQIPEPEKGTYINDKYGYLNTHERLEINKQLRTIEDSTGVQVAIIVVPAVPDRYSIEDYAREIGRKWHVGNAKNGIVYVAAIDQRKQRMEVANHLEGTITDATAGRLIGSTKPYFRAQKYASGITYMVTQLQIELLKDKVEQLQLTADELKKKKAQGLPFWAWLLLWPVCFGVPSFVIFRIIRKRRAERRRKAEEAEILRLKKQLDIEKKSYDLAQKSLEQHQANMEKKKYNKYGQPINRTNIISDDPALIIPPPEIQKPSKSYDEDNYSSGSSGSGYSGYSSGSSDSGSSSSSSSDYGSWGSGSSDSGSSSSDSGYSGGGASDSW
jgi:uncharacterized protein